MAVLAILPDVHANAQALEVVLADAQARGASLWAAPGDIVGFGGSPLLCVQRLRELGACFVRGNHEEALARPALFGAFPPAQRMAERTRDLLPPALLHHLTTLPFTAEAAGIPMVHASFHTPGRWARLREVEEAALSITCFSAPLAFFGHTHRPTLFRRGADGSLSLLPPCYDAEGSFVLRLAPGERYLVNPGSVGQPRDGDPRAAYALYDVASCELTLRRVPYDVEAAAASATAAMGLPEAFAHALRRGLSPL